MQNFPSPARLFLFAVILGATPAAAIDVGGCTEPVPMSESLSVNDAEASNQEIEIACWFNCCNGNGNCNGGVQA